MRKGWGRKGRGWRGGGGGVGKEGGLGGGGEGGGGEEGEWWGRMEVWGEEGQGVGGMRGRWLAEKMKEQHTHGKQKGQGGGTESSEAEVHFWPA